MFKCVCCCVDVLCCCQVIPGARKMGYPVQAYAFQGYWEDIGTIEAFYNANLALVKTDGSANFRSAASWQKLTHRRPSS